MAARILIILGCIWIVGIAYLAGITWPVFPLDMPAQDPQVRAAYDSAISAHLIRYALIALVPGVALLGIAWALSRRSQRTGMTS